MFIHGQQQFTDHGEIANQFNIFFANIGPIRSSSINYTGDNKNDAYILKSQTNVGFSRCWCVKLQVKASEMRRTSRICIGPCWHDSMAHVDKVRAGYVPYNETLLRRWSLTARTWSSAWQLLTRIPTGCVSWRESFNRFNSCSDSLRVSSYRITPSI